MTREEREEAIKELTDLLLEEFLMDYANAIKMGIEALEQESCKDAVSRQAVLEQINCWIGSGEYKYTNATYYLTKRIQNLSPATPSPKIGCEGCIYEKTGTNSTYPCSHCSRCYTDKYKIENEVENDTN